MVSTSVVSTGNFQIKRKSKEFLRNGCMMLSIDYLITLAFEKHAEMFNVFDPSKSNYNT